MKKRILSAVALLCMVVCLSGCSSNQGVDVDSIEWVTEGLEEYYTFQVPIQWEGANTEFGALDDPDVPGGVSIYRQMEYGTVERYMESEDIIPSGRSLETKEPMVIGGQRGYHYVLSSFYYDDNGQPTTTYFDHYAFEANGAVFDVWFNPITDKNVREYIINSITIL
mgnify:CR=1 FL=1